MQMKRNKINGAYASGVQIMMPETTVHCFDWYGLTFISGTLMFIISLTAFFALPSPGDSSYSGPCVGCRASCRQRLKLSVEEALEGSNDGQHREVSSTEGLRMGQWEAQKTRQR